MVIFPIIIVLALVLYIYYKVSILRSKDKLTQSYFNAKSRICLGVFVLFFGINQYLYYQTKLSLFIGIVFVILGGMQFNLGFKETKHYRKEWRRLNPAEK
ncbi:YtpI family protein [Lentibacillus sp. Marseille-P4043]|uniref:YtpI family protein n=1 Tax=Lentibacillus sp. Marseille-P4043 TaxID=2040293 RepID=UPI000D0B49E6|nr:YtpI family protein [Lentibacillus sp. Marseille-P4043]